MAYASLADVYLDTLGRTPDDSGLAAWTAALNSGMTLDQVSQQIQQSQEFQARAAEAAANAGESYVPYTPTATAPATAPSALAGTPFAGMSYDQLVALANQNRDKDDQYKPYFTGMPGFEGLTVTSPDGVDPRFFLHNPDTKQGAGGQGWELYRNDDGSLGSRAYTYDSEMGMLGPLLMATMPVWAPALGGLLGGAEAAGAAGTSGASGTVGASAAGAGEFVALPAGGMTATGAAPWGLTGGGLGSGMTTLGMEALTVAPELLGTGLAGSMTAAAPFGYTLGGSIMAGAPGTLSTATGLGSAVTNFINTGAGLTPLTPWYPTTPGLPPGSPPPGTPGAPSTPPGGTPPVTPPVTPPGGGVPPIIKDILTSPLTPAIVGAVAGATDGSKQGSSTTTVEPWSAQQPYLKDLYANAKGVFDAYKNPSAAEIGALSAIQQRAATGSPLQTAAKSNIQSLLGQDPTKAYGIGQANQYLGQNINVGSNPMMGMNNPFLNNAITAAQDDVTRAMQPQFQAAQRASGSFGNSGLQETYARELPKALGNISNSMRMTDYTQQQQLQENALNRSVAAQQADLTRNAGLAQQGIQNNIGQYNTMLGLQTDAAYRAPGLAAADYNDPQMAYNTAFGARQNAFMPLQQYQSAISGNPGSSTTSPYFTNPAANILGGATAGLGLWNAAQKAGMLGGGGGGFNSWIGNNQAFLGANPDLSINDLWSAG